MKSARKDRGQPLPTTCDASAAAKAQKTENLKNVPKAILMEEGSATSALETILNAPSTARFGYRFHELHTAAAAHLPGKIF